MKLDRAIDRIESGLLQKVRIGGREANGPWSLAERMRAHGTPGASIVLAQDGEIAWAKGYGVAETGCAKGISPETLFQAGSISKPVAAVVALRLVDDGLLDPDVDVNEYLKTWTVPENEFTETERVTVRRILSHRAGLTVHGFGGYEAGREPPALAQILDGVSPANSAPIRVDVEPGSLQRYSGGGFVLLQLLIEDLTGRPFAELAEELVLRPLGMDRSTYEQPLPKQGWPEAATAHWASGEIVKGRWHTYPELPAAGLWTTPTDLAQFAVGVVNAFAGRSNAVLRQSTAREMLSPQGEESQGLSFGLRAWDGGIRFGHGGSNAGYESLLFADTGTEEGIVIQTNANWGDVLGIEIMRGLSSFLPWLGLDVVEKRIADVSEQDLQAIAGWYESDDPFEDAVARFALRADDQTLVTDASKHAGAMRFFPASRDEWFDCDLGMSLTIQRSADGAVTGFADDLWGGQARRVADLVDEPTQKERGG